MILQFRKNLQLLLFKYNKFCQCGNNITVTSDPKSHGLINLFFVGGRKKIFASDFKT